MRLNNGQRDTHAVLPPGPIRRLIDGTLDELFPAVWRQSLEEALDAGWAIDAPSKYCGRCGASMAGEGVTEKGCAFCIDTRPAWSGFTRLGVYKPPVSDWIIAMKFRGHWKWAPWLGQQLARAAPPPVRGDRTAICPVPMHWRRRWGRGFNQSFLMAQAMGEALGLPVANLLRRTKYTQPQISMPLSQRRANVRGVFAALPIDLTGWDVWLVDDVKTTGSTMTECVRALKSAGAKRVHALAAAAGDPKGTDFQSIDP